MIGLGALRSRTSDLGRPRPSHRRVHDVKKKFSGQSRAPPSATAPYLTIATKRASKHCLLLEKGGAAHVLV